MTPVSIFELVLVLLAIVIVLYWLSLTLHLPPAAALLVGGGALAFMPGLPRVELDPELALVFFLPPLLMDGAYFTALGRFRRHLPGILSLAIGAVIFTTLIVGVIAHWLVPALPWAACFALGAIVSPPDAVSARAVLQHVKLPRRLSALLEGESLLNDATGLVLYRFAIAATLSGMFDASQAVGDFFWLALGGAAVGAAVGAAWVVLVRLLHDRMLIITATLMLSWMAYLGGEALHVSGVIATVVAGLILGWYQHVIFPANVRLQAGSVNSTLIFVLEALVFILIGFSLRGVLDRLGSPAAVITTMAVPVIGVVLAVTTARFLWVYGSEAVLVLLRRAGMKRARPLGMQQATILGWTGMRGVVTLAVALSVPTQMPGRDLMLVTAFAVIFVTVVVQGTTLGGLIRLLEPQDRDPPARLNLFQAEAAMAIVRNAEIERAAVGPDGTVIHPQLLLQSRNRLRATQRFSEDAEDSYPKLVAHFTVQLASINAARGELIRIHRAGMIEDEVMHNLERDLDVEEMSVRLQLATA